MLILALSCAAALLAIAALAVALGRAASASPIVYAASLAASLMLLAGALVRLVADPGQVSTLTLPIGLPGLGAHFRLDALSAFFLVVADLGGSAASLYALGYGRHETAPRRGLPVFSALLAALDPVVLGDAGLIVFL